MNDKKKKGLIVGLSLVVSMVLIGMIGKELKKPSNDEVEIASTVPSSNDIVVEEIESTEQEAVVTPESIPASDRTEVEVSNGDDEGLEQTIQPDPKVPEYTEEALSDPSKTPDGERVEEVDIPEEEYEKETPPDIKPEVVEPNTQTNPSGGLPGFENVPNLGDNQNVYVDGMEENGNKIGIVN